jgi:hypothetical protein
MYIQVIIHSEWRVDIQDLNLLPISIATTESLLTTFYFCFPLESNPNDDPIIITRNFK